mmetsp:Transcript_68666/g.192493  ORF Transcript_68666/g.192493 Transcript_68666/m.192493 type:complete len:364 (+) Transcript_68666:58-1149(+)
MGETRVGDWQCPNPACINHTEFPTKFVFGCKANCPRCGTGKSAQRPGDWCCPNPACVNHQNTVYASKMQCTRCGAARPPLNAKGTAMPNESAMMVGGGGGQPKGGGKGSGPMPRAGDWHCPNPSCKNHRDNIIFGRKTSCPICGTDKPAQPMAAQPQQPMQGMMMQQRMMMQGGCVPAQVMQPQNGLRPGDWHCPNTSCKNHTGNVVFGSKPNCPLCGEAKPEGSAAAVPVYPSAFVPMPMPMPQQPQMMYCMAGKGACFAGGKGCGGKGGKGQPGDWHCANPACKNHTDNAVFASKSSCPICGSAKPAGGGVVATLRPGDWQCPNQSCRNHLNGVYASKSHCTICGMANPAGDRTRSRSPRQ